MFPEIVRAFKRFLPADEPIALNLSRKAVDFTALQSQWYWTNGYPMIAQQLMGGFPAWSGETVSINTALQNPTVFACNKLITECVGLTPAILKQRVGGDKRDAVSHPMHYAMLNQVNDEIDADEFTQLLTSHCLLSGNGFAKIIRRSGTGTAIEMDVLLPEQVEIDREKTGQKRIVYVIREQGSPDKAYPLQRGKPQDIFHLRGASWDGTRGYSVITLGRQSIGTAIAADKNLAKFFANGGRYAYYLKLLQKFGSKQDADQFRSDWEAKMSTPGTVPITEPWFEYTPIQSTMKDAQGIENRSFAVSEICRWFNVSPPLVHDLSRATFNNIEQLFLYFKNLTLSAWYGKWEKAFNRCVLTPEEKSQGFFLRHDTRALLRSDVVSRATAFASALQNGYMNIDEVRDEEDRDPLPDGKGEDYRVQLNMQTVGAPPVQPVPQKGLFTIAQESAEGE